MLEDVHWADDMSLRLLTFVSRQILTWPVLLLTSAREDELVDASRVRHIVQALSDLRQSTSLTLSFLSRPETDLLVRALARVGRDAVTQTQLEVQVWVVSEGNLFVVVEAVRTLDQEFLTLNVTFT